LYFDSCAGKAFTTTGVADLPGSISVLRYYAGWADKVQGKPIEVKLATHVKI
jgi:hypothetical protein